MQKNCSFVKSSYYSHVRTAGTPKEAWGKKIEDKGFSKLVQEDIKQEDLKITQKMLMKKSGKEIFVLKCFKCHKIRHKATEYSGKVDKFFLKNSERRRTQIGLYYKPYP